MAKGKSSETKAVTKAEPSIVLSPFHDMERWFEDFFRRPFFGPSWLPRLRTPEFEEISPSIDLFTEGDDAVVKAEMPGMKKEDIDVSVTDNNITVSGEKKQEEKVEKKDYYRLVRSYGLFSSS